MNAPFNIAEQRKTLRGYDAIAATVDRARIQLGRDRALANGGAYMMTYDDFVDRFGYPIAVVTDSEGTRHAHHKIASWPLDTVLCGGCDNALPLSGFCRSCGEDRS